MDGMAMRAPAPIDINNPVLHDQSNALRVGDPLVTPQFQASGALYGTNTYPAEDGKVLGGQRGNPG